MYFVIEIQKQQDGTCAHLVHTAETKDQSEMIYHQVLAAAAQSALACHSAVILDDEGHAVRGERYTHKE